MDEPISQHDIPAPVSAELLRADPRARLVLAGAIVLVFAMLAAFQFFGLPLITARMKAAPVEETILALKVIFVVFSAIGAMAAILLISYGKKIMRLQQFPLPGAWVWRDTPIKRGKNAARMARVHFVTGALVGVIFIAMMALLWNGVERLKPRFVLPEGVTILPPGEYRTSPPAPSKPSTSTVK